MYFKSCGECEEECSDIIRLLKCSLCSTWFHYSCVNMDFQKFAYISTDSDLLWLCLACRNRPWHFCVCGITIQVKIEDTSEHLCKEYNNSYSNHVKPANKCNKSVESKSITSVKNESITSEKQENVTKSIVEDNACEKCGTRLSSPDDYVRHKMTSCHEKLCTDEVLTEHNKLVNGIDLLSCIVCNKRFKSNRYLNRHIERAHSTKRFKDNACEKCGACLSSPDDYVRHKITSCHEKLCTEEVLTEHNKLDCFTFVQYM